MNARRNEIMAESIHFQQRRKLRHITKIIGVRAFGQCWASGGFGGNNSQGSTCQLARHERKGKTTEVTATSTAGDQYVRSLASQAKLLNSFQADDRLMEKDMVKDASQCVFRIRPARCFGCGFGDCQTQTSWRVWVLGQPPTAYLGL